MTISIKHRCGHTEERELKKYDPFKKVWQPMADMRHLSPPPNILALQEKQIKVAQNKAIKFWSTQLCRHCHKK